MDKIKVLFVCMGNICRSPTAHGVFRRQVEARGTQAYFEIDCAGTHAYHIDQPPDARAQAAARTRGIDISHLRARRVTVEDFGRFDYILPMDQQNVADLRAICPGAQAHKLRLLMEFAPDYGTDEVPDPYYGGASGFDRVMDMIETATAGFYAHLQRHHPLPESRD